MTIRIVRLNFLSPVHFGSGRLSSGDFTCDAAAIYSALFIEALRLGKAEELQDSVITGNLQISDAFPFIGESLYLPKSAIAMQRNDSTSRNPNQQDYREKKAYKNLSHIRTSSYTSYLSGDFNPLDEYHTFRLLGRSSMSTKVNLTREYKDEADPYAVGAYTFSDNAGLYFIVEGSYDLSDLLDSLQYAGLGGKRTTGYGRFNFSIEEVDPRNEVKRGMADMFTDCQPFGNLLLSSAVPRPDELCDALLAGARYVLKRKGGFVQSASHQGTPQKKREKYVFVPGAVFEKVFEGDVFDVAPKSVGHPVYRYAKAMWMEM